MPSSVLEQMLFRRGICEVFQWRFIRKQERQTYLLQSFQCYYITFHTPITATSSDIKGTRPNITVFEVVKNVNYVASA